MRRSSFPETADRLGLGKEFDAVKSLRLNRGLISLVANDSRRPEATAPRPDPLVIARLIGLPGTLRHALGFQATDEHSEIAASVVAWVERYLATLADLDAVIGTITWNVPLPEPVTLESGEQWTAPDDEPWMKRCLAASMDIRLPWRDERTVRDRSDRICLHFASFVLRREPDRTPTKSFAFDVLAVRQSDRLPPRDARALHGEHEGSLDLLSCLAESDFLATEALRSAGGVTAVELDDALDATNSLARAYYTHAARDVFLACHELHRWAQARRNECQDPHLVRDLDLVLSRTHGVLACTCLDLGQPTTALRHARASSLRATFAESREMYGWALGTESLILRYQRQHERSREAALEGIALNLASPTGARLHAQASATFARLHDTDETTTHLRLCAELLDSAPASDMTEGVLSFSPAMYQYYRGSDLVDLGAEYAREALLASTCAIELFQSDTDFTSQSDETLAHVHAAHALAGCGEFDGILEALGPILHPANRRTTSWQINKLERLLRVLRQGPAHDSPVIAEVRESVAEFKADMAAAQRPELPA